ncbi:hypothetical protein A9Q81_00600 [Gammaproteobacteria bacterium 42_54_T18]|nr:hypothetical protein A9Q81_00600 [Gammaproteobacteria bacterium 42_54_T18]
MSFNSFAESGSLFNTNNNVFSDSNEQEFLPASEAFKVDSTIESGPQGNVLKFHWVIADGYYLYQHRFKFKALTPESAVLGTPVIQQKGKEKQDPTFGKVTAYYHEVDISVPVISPTSGSIEVQVGYQGCADKGLCYIPQKTAMYFPLHDISSTNNTPTNTDPAVIPAQQDTSSAIGLAAVLDESSLLAIIGIFFILGLGLTFTPCVLPMIPILSGIIVGQGDNISRKKAFILSLAYVLGMASTYAIAGVIAGKTGSKLQLYMQDPTVLFTFAGVFIVLSLSMFGFYELQLPSSVQNRLNDISNKQKGGTLAGVAVMGALSALVVSPCVSAPLAGALIYIGNTGDGLLGGISLMALGLGMGAPLLVIGTTGGNILPKAGGWMDSIKGLFGVGLLAVALWLVKHLLPEPLVLLFWGLCAMIAAVYLGAFQPATTPKSQLFKGIGLSLAALAVAIILASANVFAPASSGFSSQNATNSSTEQAGLAFTRIRSQSALDQALTSAKDNNKPVMIDYYADWCISCIELEHGAFKNPNVLTLLQNHQLLQIDLTDNDEAEALLDRFNLQGPPSILFFDKEGQELAHARIYAYKDESTFLKHLRSTFN